MRLRSAVGAVALGVAAAWLWNAGRSPSPSGAAASPDRDVRRRPLLAFNHAVLNPALLAMAERADRSYPAVIRHVGRRSGRPYATPVAAVPVPSGFVVPLPYGPDTDWCLNVRAAGGGSVERNRRPVRVVRPELLTEAEAAPLISPRQRRLLGWFGVRDYLLLHDEAAATGPEPSPVTA